MINQEILKKRTKLFAVRTFKFIDTCAKSRAENVISNQLLRASSSVAANYRAACRSKSEAYFLNKLKIINEEADECLFWMEFIADLDMICDKNELQFLTTETNELVSIFTAAIKTLSLKRANSKTIKHNNQF